MYYFMNDILDNEEENVKNSTNDMQQMFYRHQILAI